MEFIAKDKGGDWYFDGGKTYLCLDKDKKTVGKIYQEYVPDPIALWQSKCKSDKISMDRPEAQFLKPNEVVYKLWEHKYANFNH